MRRDAADAEDIVIWDDDSGAPFCSSAGKVIWNVEDGDMQIAERGKIQHCVPLHLNICKYKLRV